MSRPKKTGEDKNVGSGTTDAGVSDRGLLPAMVDRGSGGGGHPLIGAARDPLHVERLLEQKGDIAQAIEKLDEDVIDDRTGMSTIDLNSRLDSVAVAACLRADGLGRIGILTQAIGLSRQKKRLMVSLGGLGRAEKVAMVQAERSQQQGIGEKFLGLFKKKPQE